MSDEAITKMTELTITGGQCGYVHFNIKYNSNGTGYRLAVLSYVPNAIDSALFEQCGMQVQSASGGSTVVGNIQFVMPKTDTTYYLIGQQNSGLALSCTGCMEAIRIR